MFKELDKYTSNDHFFLTRKDILSEVCNTPKTGIGVYLIYALKDGKVELVYIGSAGKIKQDGTIMSSSEGIYDAIVNGGQSQSPQNFSLKERVLAENIEALDVYWYKTYDQKQKDIPRVTQSMIMEIFFHVHQRLPRWNDVF